MAGTLTISTLSDGTNSTSTTNLTKGPCVAWVNFVGSTAAINASYNVSSITRRSAGYYAVNFTNALTDANYAFAGIANPTVSYSGVMVCIDYVLGISSSVANIRTISDGGSSFDSPTVTVKFVR